MRNAYSTASGFVAMKHFCPARTALRVPLSRRCLSSSTTLCRSAAHNAGNNASKTTTKSRQKKEVESDPSFTAAKSSTPSKGLTKINARLNDDSRSGSVSHGHDPKVRLRQDIGTKYKGRHAMFRNGVLSRFQAVLGEMRDSDFSTLGLTKEKLNEEAHQFMNNIDDAFILAEQNITRRDKNPLFWNLRDAFIQKDTKGLVNELKYSFQSFIARGRFSKRQNEVQQQMLDFRFPQEWFPGTRQLQRTIHLHVGPTNSGKTYHALKALEASKNGVYAGPLRLLAAEVYQRFTAKGRACALVTGEEIKQPAGVNDCLTSCTVEMMPLNTKLDVAVIDEIQMISDPERGSAWTNAVLGVQAKEVHLCGEERTVKLIESICASIGDKCVVHRYERLTPLKTMNTALDNQFSRLEKGDAIVAFNRMSLHALKRNVEKYTGRRCAIVYGSLPPEVRVQQAALFNDPNNDYDFIVASDAIGMGLNLEVRRVIMESVTKFDGTQSRMLTYPEIKQIGGRAGRFRSATRPDGVTDAEAEEEKIGLVTSMEHADLHKIRRAFQSHVEDSKIAYISPPLSIVERFASYYPRGTPLSFILQRVRMAATMAEPFRVSINADTLAIADVIQDFDLPMGDRLVFSHIPIRLTYETSVNMLRALARIVAENLPGDLLSIKEIPLEYLDMDTQDMKKNGPEYLHKLEALHDIINMYTWLSYRYYGTFRDQALAFHIRTLVGEKLIDLLERLDFTEKDIARLRRQGRLAAQSTMLHRSTLADNVTEDGIVLDDEIETSSTATVV
jgi:ATP-dependent RNA helicase SUPV3L1/SUV3